MKKSAQLVKFYPYLVMFIGPILLLLPIMLRGEALLWGTPILQFIPWRHYAWEILKAGHLPLWNPLVGMGAPFLANYQTGFFYPPNWLIFGADAIGGVGLAAWSQTIIVGFHWILTGIGMVKLARKIGFGDLGQIVAGLSFSLSAYVVSRSAFFSINAAITWLPWILIYSMPISIYTENDRKREVKRALKFSIMVMMLLLSGHAQIATYELLFSFAWFSYWFYENAHSHKFNEISTNLQSRMDKLLPWLYQALALALAFLLSAHQLIPTAEYLAQSQRATAVAYQEAMTYSFWPWRFLTFLAPNMFGSPVNGNYWGYSNYWEDAEYIGVLPLFTALFSVWYFLRRKKDNRNEINGSFICLLLSIIFISIIIGLGKNTPIFPWLYKHIPGFGIFQAPTRVMVLSEFCLAILAGLGIDKIKRPKERALYWCRLGTAGAIAITLGAGLTAILMGGVSPTFINAMGLFGFWGLGTGLIILFATVETSDESSKPAKVSKWIWPISVTIFILCDLIVANWGINPGVNIHALTRIIPELDILKTELNGRRLFVPDQVEYYLEYHKFMKFETYHNIQDWTSVRAAVLPDTNLLAGIATTNNYDPLVPDRYARWNEMLNNLYSSNNAQYESLLKLMNVGKIARLIDNGNVSFQDVLSGERVAWRDCAIQSADLNHSLKTIQQGDLNLAQYVLLETDMPVNDKTCQVQSTVPAPSIYSVSDPYNPNRLNVQINTMKPGWLLLADTWYPGWKAFIDGKETVIYHADYLFRSVFIDAGKHQIEFVYRPWSFYVGISMVVLGWLLLILLIGRNFSG